MFFIYDTSKMATPLVKTSKKALSIPKRKAITRDTFTAGMK